MSGIDRLYLDLDDTACFSWRRNCVIGIKFK